MISPWLPGLFLLSLLSGSGSTGDDGVVVVYLVRHAEKASNDARDPDLSDAGRARAEALASMLSDVPLTNLFASEYRRTQQTLSPLADQAGVDVTVVPAGDADALIARICALAAGSVAVVAGHSNTVPMLVRMLGASPHRTEAGDLPDDTYDRLFQLVIQPGGGLIAFAELRYAAPGTEH